jgi:hypothetical protein
MSLTYHYSKALHPILSAKETQKWNNTWPKLSSRNSPHQQLAKHLLKIPSLLSVKSKISNRTVNTWDKEFSICSLLSKYDTIPRYICNFSYAHKRSMAFTQLANTQQ